MKDIQIIDGALNATFSIFQATEEEFALIFPNEQDIELSEDFHARVGDESALAISRFRIGRSQIGLNTPFAISWGVRRFGPAEIELCVRDGCQVNT
jgi:hypothetical protein